jgi:hypothetical protein
MKYIEFIIGAITFFSSSFLIQGVLGILQSALAGTLIGLIYGKGKKF